MERNIDELIPYSQNAKKHDERQIRNVANSIKRFGWRQPVVVDNDGVIVIGHCRVLAAKSLGLDKVPVTVADDLTEDEIKELRIADNKTNESPWDFDMLEADAKGLTFEGFDFDGIPGGYLKRNRPSKTIMMLTRRWSRMRSWATFISWDAIGLCAETAQAWMMLVD